MTLPDVLKTGLKVIFCGTAVGERSAKCGYYYAGPGNSFWLILNKLGLIQESFQPERFLELPKYGIGLTDLVKVRSANDQKLKTADFDVTGFQAKIQKFAPEVLAFNGKKAAKVFLSRSVIYGLQKEQIGDTFIFVLPSTSGTARGYWNENEWVQLAKFLATAAD